MQNNTDIFIIADDSPVGKQGYRPKSMCYFLVGHRLQKWNIFLVFQVCICNAIYLSKDICLVIRVHRLAMSMESFLFCQTLIFPLLWAAGSWERGWKASKSEVCIISVVSPLTWFVSVFYIWAWVKQTKENVITVGVGDNRRQTCITHMYSGWTAINALKNVNQGFSLISFMKRMQTRQIQLLKSCDRSQMLDFMVM